MSLQKNIFKVDVKITKHIKIKIPGAVNTENAGFQSMTLSGILPCGI
jgi:hypothetical protein